MLPALELLATNVEGDVGDRPEIDVPLADPKLDPGTLVRTSPAREKLRDLLGIGAGTPPLECRNLPEDGPIPHRSNRHRSDRR